MLLSLSLQTCSILSQFSVIFFANIKFVVRGYLIFSHKDMNRDLLREVVGVIVCLLVVATQPVSN